MRDAGNFFRGFAVIQYLLLPTAGIVWEIFHWKRQDAQQRVVFVIVLVALCGLMLIWREINRLTAKPRKRRKHRHHHHDH